MRAQEATNWRVERARSRSRRTLGAAMTRAWSWRWASPAAWTAERRAARRTDSGHRLTARCRRPRNAAANPIRNRVTAAAKAADGGPRGTAVGP